MQEHSGDIKVSSALGHGSQFTLWMPIRRSRPKNARTAADTSMQKKRN
jgi:signal transduction histidine kinase